MMEDKSEYTLRVLLEDDINSAIYNRDIPTLERLLDSYGINTATTDMKRTFIFIAVDYELPDMLEWLIERGADMTHQDGLDDTALDFAARSRGLELVKIFVRHGMPLDIIGQDGFTPLNWALHMSGNWDPDTRRNEKAIYLIENGASLDIPDHVFNQSPRARIYESGNAQLISMIESKGL